MLFPPPGKLMTLPQKDKLNNAYLLQQPQGLRVQMFYVFRTFYLDAVSAGGSSSGHTEEAWVARNPYKLSLRR